MAKVIAKLHRPMGALENFEASDSWLMHLLEQHNMKEVILKSCKQETFVGVGKSFREDPTFPLLDANAENSANRKRSFPESVTTPLNR